MQFIAHPEHLMIFRISLQWILRQRMNRAYLSILHARATFLGGNEAGEIVGEGGKGGGTDILAEGEGFQDCGGEGFNVC